MNDKELLPCPFCGHPPEVYDDTKPGMNKGCYWVTCVNSECAVEAFTENDHWCKKDAINAWNTRHTPPGFKLVPTLAPVSVQRAIQYGQNEACTIQEWWEIILKSAPGPDNAAKLYSNMTQEQRDRHLNGVSEPAEGFKLVPTEATSEMIHAMDEEIKDGGLIQEVWEAGVEAAP